MIKVGVVGLGHWGPNLVRNLASLEDVRITALCDLDQVRAASVARKWCPNARLIENYVDLAGTDDIDAVVIATPILTHYNLAKCFLEAGKHVLVEKPLARTSSECSHLIEIAQKNSLVLFVGHVFEYNSAVREVKRLLDQGELGKLLYICSQRVNLGRIQSDVNALWSFAPHDISIIKYWLGELPSRVTAKGFTYLTKGIEDVIFLILEYPSGVDAHLHLSWLDPRKTRLMTLVGARKMVVYDDVAMDARIQIFDKGIDGLPTFLESTETYAEFQFRIRTGDLLIPKIAFSEPLQVECREFIESVRTGRQPITDGVSGLNVVKVLEAAQESLDKGGVSVKVVM